MPTNQKITDYFDANLAELLSKKIKVVYPEFKSSRFIKSVECAVIDKTYTQRIEIIADELCVFLPSNYLEAIDILIAILGPENPNETGMFSTYYWVMPIGKFIEKYGLGDFDVSMRAIAEVTKRNTGEYAVRPYIRKYPKKTLRYMEEWAKSDNFHLRRLASEGLRPKLPWTSKLDEFISDPTPVFQILELLKEDGSKFVQKSVANHLTDYLKVNPGPTRLIIEQWRMSSNKNTHWIIKHATRKIN